MVILRKQQAKCLNKMHYSSKVKCLSQTNPGRSNNNGLRKTLYMYNWSV